MKPAKRNRKSDMQILLGIHLRELGIERIEYEFKFCETRKWAADLYLPSERILIEVDGGMHTGGHKRGAALEDDYLKEATAQFLGYRFIRFSNGQVSRGEAKAFLKVWL